MGRRQRPAAAGQMHEDRGGSEEVGMHCLCRRDAPLPVGGGGLSALAPEGAKRLRRLGRKGEGVPLARSATVFGALRAAVTPSPGFSKLATLAKRSRPPPPGGRGR